MRLLYEWAMGNGGLPLRASYYSLSENRIELDKFCPFENAGKASNNVSGVNQKWKLEPLPVNASLCPVLYLSLPFELNP
jgi:hypothetical protein